LVLAHLSLKVPRKIFSAFESSCHPVTTSLNTQR